MTTPGRERTSMLGPIVLVEAALFIVAVVVLWIPASRTLPVRLTLCGLYAVMAARDVRLMRRSGMLWMTPREIRATAARRPRVSVSHFATSILGCVAVVRAVP